LECLEQGIEVTVAPGIEEHLEAGVIQQELFEVELSAQQSHQVMANPELCGLQDGLSGGGLDANLVQDDAAQGVNFRARHLDVDPELPRQAGQNEALEEEIAGADPPRKAQQDDETSRGDQQRL
jgi:hypothetical protein